MPKRNVKPARKRPRQTRLHTKRNKSIRLIKGSFSVADARYLLLSLMTYKINFHELKGFGDRERLGRADEHSEERIAELKESRQELLRFLEEADLRGDTLQVDSVVKIRVAR